MDKIEKSKLWKNPCHKYVAEIIFFMFKVADALLEPSMRLYIYELSGRLYYEEGENEQQQHAATYLMIYKILVNLPALFLGLFCGAWSDRIGRKVPVMLCCFGTIIACLCFLSSLTLEKFLNFQLPLIFVGAGIRGCFGRSALISMALHSYIADMTSENARTRRLGRLLAMNYFGYFVGSLSVGLVMSTAGYDKVFIIVIMLSALCVFLAVFGMYDNTTGNDDTDSDVSSSTSSVSSQSDDMKKVIQEPNKLEQPFRLSNIRESLEILCKNRENNQRCHLLLLFFLIIVTQLCKSGEVDITLLFVERQPLHWQESAYGYLLATDYACMGIAVLTVLPLLTGKLKWKDTTLIFTGLVFKLARLFLLAFSSHTWMVYLAVVLGCPLSFIISGVKSQISKLVSEDEIGKTFSILSCGETISNLLGSVIFNNTYALTADTLFPGFMYVVDMVFHFILLFLACILFHDQEDQVRKATERDRLIN